MREEIQVLKCTICGLIDADSNGIVIKNCYICGNCEKNIVKSHCGSDNYNFYVNGLKNIWRCT